MRIKIDENISRHLKPLLVREGHEAATAGEEGLLGKTDIEVGTVAKAEEMLLFTLDLEFADLRKFPPGSHPGVVLFRPQGMGPVSVNSFILDFVKTTNLLVLAGCTVVVDPTRVRVRRPSSDANNSE